MLNILLIIVLSFSAAIASEKIPQCGCVLEDLETNSVNYERLKKIEALNQEIKQLEDDMVTEIVIKISDHDKLKEIRNYLKENIPGHIEHELENYTYFDSLTVRVKKKDVSRKVIDGILKITNSLPEVRAAEAPQRALYF